MSHILARPTNRPFGLSRCGQVLPVREFLPPATCHACAATVPASSPAMSTAEKPPASTGAIVSAKPSIGLRPLGAPAPVNGLRPIGQAPISAPKSGPSLRPLGAPVSSSPAVSTPSATTSTPSATTSTPSATTSTPSTSTPAVAASTPAVAASTPAATTSTPEVAASTPEVVVSTPSAPSVDFSRLDFEALAQTYGRLSGLEAVLVRGAPPSHSEAISAVNEALVSLGFPRLSGFFVEIAQISIASLPVHDEGRAQESSESEDGPAGGSEDEPEDEPEDELEDESEDGSQEGSEDASQGAPQDEPTTPESATMEPELPEVTPKKGSSNKGRGR